MKCEKLKAEHHETTCIARQRAIKRQADYLAKHKLKGNGPAWGMSGGDGANVQYISCVGCETGLSMFYQAGGITPRRGRRRKAA